MQQMQEEKNVYGIFSPVINGRRYFMDAATKEMFPMEADADEKEILSIGRFQFSAAGFQKATTILHNAIQQNEGWLIIDEVGPLELKGEGFCDVIFEILESASKQLKIVLVVREELLNEVTAFFRIPHFHNLDHIT